jgi:neutral ceramidase
LRPAALSWSEGELHDANINRSPTAYENNPAAERAQYKHDVDKEMTLLRIQTPDGIGR